MMKPKMIDNLDSNSNQDFLSANMGRVLNKTKLSKTLDSYELIIDAINGDDTIADGSVELPFKTITSAYNYLPDFVNNAILNIKDGTYKEHSSIQLYKNIVKLTIKAFNTSNTSNVVIMCNEEDTRDSLLYITNSHKIIIENIKFNRSGNHTSGSCINIDCTNFDINNCLFENSYIAITSSCCHGQINSCQFDNLYNAINANKASNILSTNNESLNLVEYGIISNGSIVFNYGDNLTGTIEDYITTLYGRVFNTSRDIAVASIESNGSIISRGDTAIS